jgi:hypothetical protein
MIQGVQPKIRIGYGAHGTPEQSQYPAKMSAITPIVTIFYSNPQGVESGRSI